MGRPGKQVLTLGPGSMAASGLNCGKPLVGTGWVISFFLCMNGLGKQFWPGRASISGRKLFSHSIGATIGQVLQLLKAC